MTAKPKPWYQSKTILFNILIIAISFAEYLAGRPISANQNAQEILLAVITLGNLVLRLNTKKPIR